MDFSFSPTNLPKEPFINNEYVTPSSSIRTLSVHNPIDGSLVADDVPIADEFLVDSAVDAAEAAFPAWRRLPGPKRRAILTKFASLLEQYADQFAELTRLTLGAPKATFGKFEVNLCAEVFQYYAGWVDKFTGESLPQDDGFLKIVRHEPLGVTVGIVPWNGPLGTVGLKAAPALASGNVFILKPSEKTPFAALALGPLIKEAGFPPGVFQVLPGDGSTGALLAKHMRVRKVSFTGSVPVGKKIQEMAANSNLKRVTLELGGKSPAIVFDDANLEVAVPWLEQAITANTGQVCFAASRVYVQEGIYDEFIAKYKAAIEAKAKKVGNPNDDATAVGPLVDNAQFERVTGFIDRAQAEKQGTLLTGGNRLPGTGFFIEPTVFTDVNPCSEIHNTEIFGPVSVVRKFKTEEEVIQWANDSEFGLMAGVFSQDINRALRVASEFDAGMVGVNCVSLMFPTAAFGGTKQSGSGREGGIHALRAFTDPKTIMINLNY